MAVVTVREVREKLGWTLQKTAKESGVSDAHISRIERGIEVPSLDVICKLAAAMGVLPEELYICEECRSQIGTNESEY